MEVNTEIWIAGVCIIIAHCKPELTSISVSGYTEVNSVCAVAGLGLRLGPTVTRARARVLTV